MYLFESLDSYKNAVQLAAVIQMTAENFPKSTAYFIDRLVDVSNSIHENIANAHAHWKEEEKKQFFWKSRELIMECFGLIDVASRQGFLNDDQTVRFRRQLDVITSNIQETLRGSAKWASRQKLLQETNG